MHGYELHELDFYILREWELKESIGWCECGWMWGLCKSRVVGGTPVSLSWFLKISSLARLSSEFWVYDLLVDTGVFAVQTVCRAEPGLSDFTFQHIPATVDSRKVHGCDLGMMAPQGLRMIRYWMWQSVSNVVMSVSRVQETVRGKSRFNLWKEMSQSSERASWVKISHTTGVQHACTAVTVLHTVHSTHCLLSVTWISWRT